MRFMSTAKSLTSSRKFFTKYTLLAVLFKGLDGFPHFLTMLCTSFFFANSCHQAPLTQTIGTGNLSILCTLVTLKCPMI
uniref:Uncharacterized protein n=1 Tax=Picea glauca TaxID=3330 RepID=A0A117NGR4_PICGL|nr:hypothetical protein ABT39_MTgene6189 [Picea glauca]QHR88710.1 hypothetical protein Q903MT_gene2724 [Picea sitchensis]